MRDMGADGYAPKSRSKAFRLLKQALKWAVAQDPTSKNPCGFRKPPRHETGVARGDLCTPGTRGRGPAPQPSSARQGPLDPPQGERP